MAALIPQSQKDAKQLSRRKDLIQEKRGAEKWIYKGKEIIYLPTERIKPNRYQPRLTFNKEALEELKASIKQKGVVQPILVRPLAGEKYELIAGERRLRAVKALGVDRIPAIIKQLPDVEAMELSLIENLQREDLNPMEQAKAYKRLIDEFGFIQEDVAERIGKDRSSVANILRLLNLPEQIQDYISKGVVSFAHAKIILSLKEKSAQIKLAKAIVNNQLTVRQAQKKIEATNTQVKIKPATKDAEIIALEEELQRALGTKVTIVNEKKGGKLIIEFFSHTDLERILKKLKASG